MQSLVGWNPKLNLPTLGHPPSDEPAYRYLLQISRISPGNAFIRICGFLHALFDQAAVVVQSLVNPTAASCFREYMEKDMLFQNHGGNRVQFYQKVVDIAKV